MQELRFPRRALPILRRAEVVVVGGSFAGIAAALTFSRAGRQVTLVEPRTYLGREVTATLRPWVTLAEPADLERLPELIAACVDASGTAAVGQEIPLQPDAVKLCLEDLLLASGVDLLYASLPVGLLPSEEALGGLIIGNKSGRQVLTCQVIVDATETASVARIAGATFEPGPAVSGFSRTLEFDAVSLLQTNELTLPEDLGFIDNVVTVHRGYRGEPHILIECWMELPSHESGLAAAMGREIEARHRTMRLASHLISHAPAFHYARLATASYELHGLHTSRLAGPPPGWAAEFSALRLSVAAGHQPAVDAPLVAFAGPVPQLWCLNPAARLDPAQAFNLSDPVIANLAGTALADHLLACWESPLPRQAPLVPVPTPSDPASTPGLEVKEPPSPQRGRQYEECVVPSEALLVFRTADILVVGGGTSGASAAITSAQQGLRTVLLEMNPDLGGTGTLGGVDSYWFGRRVGFAARVTRWVEEVHDSLDYEGRTWNIEAKQYALLRQAARSGVEVFCNSAVIGAVVERDRVRGAVAATRFGPVAVLADVIIDATGDGDVAAFAGAEFVYGSADDHLTMWYSLAQFKQPGRSQNNFTSMVDVSNVEDYTRAILAGRRRGGECHDHGIYVAPRESRHILADAVLTLTDQLLHRRWPDVVNLHFSNHDIKGHSSSDWIRQGLIPPNLEIELPYRVLLPRGLEGLLVAGKAISATHDALPAIRMQADLENLGGVVALAAAQAVRAGVVPRHIDLAVLQRELVDAGLLPESVLTRTLEPHRASDAELEALLQSLHADRPLYAYSDMEMEQVFRDPVPFVEICAAGPRMVPMLQRALASAVGARRVRIAQALALLRSPTGVPTLTAEIMQQLSGPTLPAREAYIRHTQLPPDQGAMPDVVYLIYALGMARDRRSLIVWARVAELLAPTQESMRDEHQGIFYYVDAVCFGAERLGDPAAISILEQIHAHTLLRDQVTRTGFQPDYFQERLALLELAISRALARCGCTGGIKILIDYLQDSRALLAEGAHTALAAISDQDYGKDTQAWEEWLAATGGTWKPRPLTEEN
jgi:ribulose 1,5-bisphosphate synthetase/thiazole synthase